MSAGFDYLKFAYFGEKKNLQYGTKIYGKSPINKFILYTTKSNKYNRKGLDY